MKWSVTFSFSCLFSLICFVLKIVFSLDLFVVEVYCKLSYKVILNFTRGQQCFGEEKLIHNLMKNILNS